MKTSLSTERHLWTPPMWKQASVSSIQTTILSCLDLGSQWALTTAWSSLTLKASSRKVPPFSPSKTCLLSTLMLNSNPQTFHSETIRSTLSPGKTSSLMNFSYQISWKSSWLHNCQSTYQLRLDLWHSWRKQPCQRPSRGIILHPDANDETEQEKTVRRRWRRRRRLGFEWRWEDGHGKILPFGGVGLCS